MNYLSVTLLLNVLNCLQIAIIFIGLDVPNMCRLLLRACFFTYSITVHEGPFLQNFQAIVNQCLLHKMDAVYS